jgi:hypothetical protein
MPKHTLSFKLPRTVDVANRDFEFLIYSKSRRKPSELLGTLKVSKGSIDWHPGNAKLSRVLLWERFAELAEKHGSRRIKA